MYKPESTYKERGFKLRRSFVRSLKPITECLPPVVNKAEDATDVKVPLTVADAGFFAGKYVAEFHRRGQRVMRRTRPFRRTILNHKDQFRYDEKTGSYIPRTL